MFYRVLFLLLIAVCINNKTYAQAYNFETEDASFDDGSKYAKCDTKGFVELGNSSPNIDIGIIDRYISNGSPALRFRLYYNAYDDKKKSLGIANNIRKLAFSIPNGKEIKENATISLYLSNGDVLRGSQGKILVSNILRAMMEGSDNIGVIDFSIGTSMLKSSQNPEKIMTFENQKIICQKLRTHNIVKIEVDGISFNTNGLRSAATYNAMFNALAKKTGKGDLYKNTQSSYSSSSQNNERFTQTKPKNQPPSATIENVKVSHNQQFSEGEGMTINMKLTVSGAKGKRIEVIAFFYDENGNEIKTTNSGYKTTSNSLCTYNSSEATYDTSVWNNFNLNLPYYTVNMQGDTKKVKYFIVVRTLPDNKKIAETGWYSTQISKGIDNRGIWPSKINRNDGEYLSSRIEEYIEHPFCLTYSTTYKDCMNSINKSNMSGWINKKQIQVHNRKAKWALGFMGLETHANIFFKNKGNEIDYYDYNFHLPKSMYTLSDANALCYHIMYYAAQHGYVLQCQNSEVFKATGFSKGKSLSLSVGEFGSSEYGVCLRITP